MTINFWKISNINQAHLTRAKTKCEVVNQQETTRQKNCTKPNSNSKITKCERKKGDGKRSKQNKRYTKRKVFRFSPVAFPTSVCNRSQRWQRQPAAKKTHSSKWNNQVERARGQMFVINQKFASKQYAVAIVRIFESVCVCAYVFCERKSACFVFHVSFALRFLVTVFLSSLYCVWLLFIYVWFGFLSGYILAERMSNKTVHIENQAYITEHWTATQEKSKAHKSGGNRKKQEQTKHAKHSRARDWRTNNGWFRTKALLRLCNLIGIWYSQAK